MPKRWLFQEKTNTKGIKKSEAFNVEYLEPDKLKQCLYVNKLLVNNFVFTESI